MDEFVKNKLQQWGLAEKLQAVFEGGHPKAARGKLWATYNYMRKNLKKFGLISASYKNQTKSNPDDSTDASIDAEVDYRNNNVNSIAFRDIDDVSLPCLMFIAVTVCPICTTSLVGLRPALNLNNASSSKVSLLLVNLKEIAHFPTRGIQKAMEMINNPYKKPLKVRDK
ncbi:hypothetical protein RN001_006160 [Aquatica leii]|uniref:Uncharacterized protein n=1 Tax=Aquatica leii TaxID=1421715 RepID=A0AAN7SB47_9COLE|nr:hypothetical protein RN001_006160 [Aquatica leii]